MKKTTALLLILIMVVALIPGITVSASSSGKIDGTEITWTLDDSGNFILAGTGTMPDYESATVAAKGTPWTDKKAEIKTVVVKGSLVTVGKNAFSECSALTTITFEEGITTIGMDVMAYCDALKTVNLPSTLTTLQQGCAYNEDDKEVEFTNITAVNYNGTKEDWTAKVTSIGNYNDNITKHLVYNPVQTNSGTNSGTDSGTVKTGDSMVYLTIVAVIALCGMAVVVKKVRI